MAHGERRPLMVAPVGVSIWAEFRTCGEVVSTVRLGDFLGVAHNTDL